MIYREQLKVPEIRFCNTDFREQIEAVKNIDNVVVVTDPPFNIGYHYGKYKDKMDESDYYEMLSDLVNEFPTVMIHYPESLYRVAIETGKTPKRVCSWVYNSNTARQHRDIVFWDVEPNFKNTLQPYKNLNDKRIQERIARGCRGGADVRLVEC
jgi:hypothetical protein